MQVALATPPTHGHAMKNSAGKREKQGKGGRWEIGMAAPGVAVPTGSRMYRVECKLEKCPRSNRNAEPGRGGGGGGGTQVVRGRSRMTLDPRVPTMPGRSTSDFHQPGRYCLHQARSALRCSASRMTGELHPFKNRS